MFFFTKKKTMYDFFFDVDGIETGHCNRIPLWLFGFLY